MNSPKSIAELAYELWVARGRPHGSEEEDWLEAERQLARAGEADPKREGGIDSSLEETFPASDPPASHIPDIPPSNAADKWAASRARHPPVDESDDAPATAPGDIGEGP